MTKPFWILLYLKMEPCSDVDSHHTMVLELLLIYLLDSQLILRYYQIIAQSVRPRVTVTKNGRKTQSVLL